MNLPGFGLIPYKENTMGAKKSSGKKDTRKAIKRKPPKKQSSDETSSLASRALRGEKLTQKEILSLAGAVLSQDEIKGKRE